MHTAAFASVGLDGVYEARDVPVEQAAIAEAVAALRAPDCLGANVTAPHKLAVIPFLDGLEPEAALLGAVNTILHRDGRLTGDNTDARGLQAWMDEADLPVAGRPCLVLGAGGAARATVLALARKQAGTILIANRTVARAEQLARDLAPHVGRAALQVESLERLERPSTRQFRVVVNATSLGHEGRAPRLDPSWYTANVAPVAVDLAYNPAVTAFMSAAEADGARTENGLGMLIHQAAISFERWTGLQPPLDVFTRAAMQALVQRGGEVQVAVLREPKVL